MSILHTLLAIDAGGSSGPTSIDAGGSTGTGGTKLTNPLGSSDIWGLADKILAFIIKVGAIVIVFMIVYVGFLFVTAQGNETKLTAAKQALLWTVIGAVILLGAQVISSGICNTVLQLGGTGSCT